MIFTDINAKIFSKKCVACGYFVNDCFDVYELEIGKTVTLRIVSL